jgi:hypothetical protein
VDLLVDNTHPAQCGQGVFVSISLLRMRAALQDGSYDHLWKERYGVAA